MVILPALPRNIKQGWKRTRLPNALAYYDTATITAVKSYSSRGLRRKRMTLTNTLAKEY
jgi:hypothetical protein